MWSSRIPVPYVAMSARGTNVNRGTDSAVLLPEVPDQIAAAKVRRHLATARRSSPLCSRPRPATMSPFGTCCPGCRITSPTTSRSPLWPRKANLSERQFNRLFKADSGTTPGGHRHHLGAVTE
jgi:hypothetical protein